MSYLEDTKVGMRARSNPAPRWREDDEMAHVQEAVKIDRKPVKAVVNVFVYVYCPECDSQLDCLHSGSYEGLKVVECGCGAKVQLPKNPYRNSK